MHKCRALELTQLFFLRAKRMHRVPRDYNYHQPGRGHTGQDDIKETQGKGKAKTRQKLSKEKHPQMRAKK